MLSFPIGTSGQTIILSDVVLELFDRFRQSKLSAVEAGGQLFASFSNDKIQIVKATGPRITDKRGRTHYRPDRVSEQREIAAMHGAGLHYVGDWHTHPEAIPSPSLTDLRSINECVLHSRHKLNAFLMIIVGTDSAQHGLHVSLNDGESSIVLNCEHSKNSR